MVSVKQIAQYQVNNAVQTLKETLGVILHLSGEMRSTHSAGLPSISEDAAENPLSFQGARQAFLYVMVGFEYD